MPDMRAEARGWRAQLIFMALDQLLQNSDSTYTETGQRCLYRSMRRQLQWFGSFLILVSLAIILQAQQPFVHGSDIAFAIWADQTTYAMAETLSAPVPTFAKAAKVGHPPVRR